MVFCTINFEERLSNGEVREKNRGGGGPWGHGHAINFHPVPDRTIGCNGSVNRDLELEKILKKACDVWID